MKKYIHLLIIFVLALTLLTACSSAPKEGSGNNPKNNSSTKDNSNSQEEATPEDFSKFISSEDIKSIELFNEKGDKIKSYDESEIEKLSSYLNNCKVDQSAYIEMLTGNSIIITLENNNTITLTSYGSNTNIIATGNKNGAHFSYHLICPEIAEILLEDNQK